jgi:hypothetical protein
MPSIHYSESLQVIQNEKYSRRYLCWQHEKVTQRHKMDFVPTLHGIMFCITYSMPILFSVNTTDVKIIVTYISD